MSFPNRPLIQLGGSTGPVHALCYSASPSTYILAGSADRNIRLYNPSRSANDALIQTYNAHGYHVLDLDVTTDNARFASVGGDRAVFLWDVATATTLRRFGGGSGHGSRINSVTFAGTEDSLLVSGSFDATVRIWDTKASSMKPIQILSEARDSVSAVVVQRGGGHEIFTGSVDGRLRTYDIRMGKLDVDVIGRPITSLSVTKDGQAILVGTLDGMIRLMDRKDGKCLMAYKGGHEQELRIRSCFGYKEKWVLTGTEKGSDSGKEGDGEVLVWDTMSGTIMHHIKVPGISEEMKKAMKPRAEKKERNNAITAVAWKDDGRGDQWCCASTDGLVTVFGA